MSNSFSIIIFYHTEVSTMHFVRRQLNYYHSSSLPMSVIVAISGDEALKSELEKFINALKNQNITYFTTHEKNIKNTVACMEKICEALKRVKTTYVTLNGADDCIIPSVAYQGVKLIEKNSEMAGVKGRTVHYDDRSGRLSILKDIDFKSNCSIERQKLAIKDLDSVFYIIRRTKDLLKEYETICCLAKRSKNIGNSAYQLELLKSILMTSKGKTHTLPIPWRVQTSHENNHSKHTPSANIRLELGLISRDDFTFLKSEHNNLHGLKYSTLRFWYFYSQIKLTSILNFKQVTYRFIKGKSGLIGFLRSLSYLILGRIYGFLKRFIQESWFVNLEFYHPKSFLRSEAYFEMKKYYFSEKEIRSIESNSANLSEPLVKSDN